MHHVSRKIPMWGSLGTGTLPRYLGCLTSPRKSPCGDLWVQEHYLIQGSAPTSWGPQTGEGTQSLLLDITLPDTEGVKRLN